MAKALEGTQLQLPGQTAFYKGKVRDVYTLADGRLLMVATDRISAFDFILPKAIPHKGQILNQTAVHFLEATRDICPNWLQQVPDPNVAIGLACQPYMVEMVVRAYLVGHAWREYQAGKRVLCGVPLPEGMRENDAFPEPILTPATKATEGHDEDISREDIIARGIVPEREYQQLEAYALALFARGTAMAAERGLILADTKYEFGQHQGKIYLIDEIHTPDSSRYFYAQGYSERQAKGEKQRQLSKEFVREWLMENGFQGLEGQQMPDMPDAFVAQITQRYTELYERITGKSFEAADTSNMVMRIEENVLRVL